MNRTEKTNFVSGLEAKLKTAKLALLARYRGLSVAQTNQLRRELRGVGGECKVTKNTLARRAVASTDYRGVERWLEGQTALVLGYEDPVAVAKVITKWAETEGEKFWIKGGVFEGQVLEPKAVVALSKTPSKDVLRAQLLAVLLAPATELVRLLAEPGTQLARVMNSRKDQLEPQDAGSTQ